jgi:hypothetical protein
LHKDVEALQEFRPTLAKAVLKVLDKAVA